MALKDRWSDCPSISKSSKKIIIGWIFRICRYLIANPPQPWYWSISIFPNPEARGSDTKTQLSSEERIQIGTERIYKNSVNNLCASCKAHLSFAMVFRNGECEKWGRRQGSNSPSRRLVSQLPLQRAPKCYNLQSDQGSRPISKYNFLISIELLCVFTT